MKKRKFLLAMAGTLILVLQSILPALAVDEAEDLQRIKAELESMLPEEQLGKYAKGEVIGEAYVELTENISEAIVQEKTKDETEIEEKQKNEIALFSATGSPAVITPGAGHVYGSWGTCEFSVRTQTGTYLGFCAQPNSTTPSGTFSVSELNSDTIKALILCYVIPELYENLGKNIFNERDKNTYAYCHAAVGYAYCGSLTGLSASMAQGVKNMVAMTQYQMAANGTLQRYMSEYKVYVAYNAQQDIVWVEPAPEGMVKVSKSSSNKTITNGNNCYNLAGAVYGVYTDAACTNQVATLTTDESGNSNAAKLNAGTYWVREIQTPQGYAWNQTIYQTTIRSGETAVVTTTDMPTMNPIEILLRKVDSETGENHPQGQGTLEGALFDIKFYGGAYETNPQEQGIDATRSWVVRTDENGIVKMKSEYFVSGDEFYTMANGEAAFPLGVVVIQEKKAPEGYLINSEVHVVKISGDNKGAETINVYEAPEIAEQVITLEIVKVQKETKTSIAGARFLHTMPDGGQEEITTDTEGKAILKGLTRGEHIIEESFAPDGYSINPGKVRLVVSENNEIEMTENTATVQNGQIQFEKKKTGGTLEVEDVCALYQLRIHKKNELDKKLKGAEFTLYQDKECKKKITSSVTDENGELIWDGLLIGQTYYVQETKAPDGYRIPVNEDGSDKIYEILASSNPMEDIFTCTIDNESYDRNEENNVISGTKSERMVTMNIVNQTERKLPKTGSGWNLLFVFAGICSMTGMVRLWRYKNGR